MKKGLRFQTKLMLTFAITIIGVTVALVIATEAKVRQAYVQQFTREFKGLMKGLDESRGDRSRDSFELCRKLAETPFVAESLQDSPSDESTKTFWKYYLESLREMEGAKQGRTSLSGAPGAKRPQAISDIANKVGTIAVMSLEGEVKLLSPSDVPAYRRGRTRRFDYNNSAAREELERFLKAESQQTIYIPLGLPEGKVWVQEMVSTPVKDPDSGELLGLFLRAASAETEAQRSLERYQEEFGTGVTIQSGIYLDGTIYSRSISDPVSAELAHIIAPRTVQSGSETSTFGFEAQVGEEEYYVYLDRLTDTTAPRQAYQIATFSLASLKNDLNELRLRGSGIGVGVLLASLIVVWFLTRNLAIPIQDLTIGTRAIREGRFDHRVKVRAKDEIGDLADSFNEMAEDLKQKALYRELLGKVSDETVAHALVSGTLDLELGGEIKEVSVLFCDIRGFTRLTEHMHPNEVIEMLNEHMTAMTAVVRQHYGVVDKFVGDEIMAVFGALKSYDNDALNAANCALDMIAERNRLNRELDQPIEIGVGVATGEVVAGCMGSIDRLNYTVLGARVNLAARLCGVAGEMEVVVDDATVERIDPSPTTEPLTELSLKGFSQTVEAFRLLRTVSPITEPAHASEEGG